MRDVGRSLFPPMSMPCTEVTTMLCAFQSPLARTDPAGRLPSTVPALAFGPFATRNLTESPLLPPVPLNSAVTSPEVIASCKVGILSRGSGLGFVLIGDPVESKGLGAGAIALDWRRAIRNSTDESLSLVTSSLQSGLEGSLKYTRFTFTADSSG